MDPQELLEHWEVQLRYSIGEEARLHAAVNVAACLSRLGRNGEALAMLDQVTPRRPSPLAMARWLNGRAYSLTMVDRAGEALDHLDDAAVLVDESTARSQSLAGCINGTRGIALLHLGRPDEAEPLLFRALEMGRAAAAAEGGSDGPIARGERHLAAERWYWLAEAAARRGDAAEERYRLNNAAGAEGRFARRAAERLGIAEVVEYPQDWDLEWVAVDGHGRVASFTNAGSGPIPTFWLRDPRALERLMSALKALPEITGSRPSVDDPHLDNWVQLARRGLFAFDWTGTDEAEGRYLIKARPTVPAQVDALEWPDHLKELLAQAANPRLDLDAETVDVRSVFDCLEGERR